MKAAAKAKSGLPDLGNGRHVSRGLLPTYPTPSRENLREIGHDAPTGEGVTTCVARSRLARLARGLREVEVTLPSLAGEGVVASALALPVPAG